MMKYIWDKEFNLFRPPNMTAFGYTDGDEVEQRLFDIIKNANDRSTFSIDLINNIKDWPSEYHLSRSRHCLVRPLGIKPGEKVLELGCGCGAITRYLGEIGAEVVAVEGSITRASIAAERCRDLTNVRVFADDLQHFETEDKFDWILLVGVLEYAPVFSDDKEPVRNYLCNVVRFLALDGRLVIAIENKLGLKYFNGCCEDHLGIPFFGVQNLYNVKTPRTFGRQELLEQLSEIGFSNSYFYYPFPDYKLPSTILSDDALKDPQLDAVDLIIRSNTRDYTGSLYRLFDESLVYSTLNANGLFADFSNSFLVISSMAKNMPYKPDSLAMTFAINRVPEFSVVTSFNRFNNIIYVKKESVFPDCLRKRPFQGYFNILNMPKSSIYHSGRQMFWRLLRARANKATLSQIAAELHQWVKYLIQFGKIDSSIEPSMPEAKDRNNLKYWLVPGIYLDCTPFNLIESSEGLIFVDDEWQADNDIPLGWVITRGILHSLSVGLAPGNPIRSVVDVVCELCGLVGLSTTETEVSGWVEMEAKFLSLVTGQKLSDIPISVNNITSGLISLNQEVADKDGQLVSLNQAVADKIGQLASLNQGVADKDGQLVSLNQAIADKDGQLASLNQGVADKDGQLVSLNQAVADKNGQLASLNQAVADKDRRLVSLNQEVADKDVQIANLSQAITEKDRQIATIVASCSWQITRPLRFFGKMFKIRQNNKKKITLKKRLLRSIVSTYFSNTLIRQSFTLGASISNKFVHPLFPRLHDLVFVDSKLYVKQQWLNDHVESNYNKSTGLYSFPELPQGNFYPKISVIVPNYNHGRYLRSRLDSIYRQSYRNIEVILLDDASTDESIKILDEYRQRHPDITRCYFNNKNSGGVFFQWKNGIELAQGDLIWIAESDDYCSENLLEELVKFFSNEAIMLAYCKTVFVDGETTKQIWSMEEYLAEIVDPAIWNNTFIKSAHQLVNMAWAIKNIIPNVSSAVFRNPGKLALLNNEKWQRMRICGDWIFYLHIIHGGLIAYTPSASNFFRIHKTNTSVQTYKRDIYYQEHEKVAEELVKFYHLQDWVLEKQQHVLELHWQMHRTDFSQSHFKECYDYDRIRRLYKNRKPNLLMITFALAAGGGETFPIKLANLLKSAGYGVTLLNCQKETTEIGIRKMLRRDIPLLELDRFDKLNDIANDMGIEIVHSHHAWVDVTICTLLENNSNCKIVITTHGMYEMMSRTDLARVIPLLSKRVDKFVYAANKNLEAFDLNTIGANRFVKIGNALDLVPITPISREELGINNEDFVLCLVSRAIPEKGWEEGIESVKLARKLTGKEIHLLLIGEGPEYKRLRHQVKDHFIHFLGFRANIRDYFACSDMGFLPSRFRGESFPLVVIDSLHSNRPVLASDIGEIANMIKTESGLAGEVFPLDNWRIPVRRLAEIIAENATNKNLYSKYLNRVTQAANKFDPDNLLHNYELVYQEILCAKKNE